MTIPDKLIHNLWTAVIATAHTDFHAAQPRPRKRRGVPHVKKREACPCDQCYPRRLRTALERIDNAIDAGEFLFERDDAIVRLAFEGAGVDLASFRAQRTLRAWPLRLAALRAERAFLAARKAEEEAIAA